LLKYLIIFIPIFFISCSKPIYQTQDSALIVIKSKTLKYADMGFIYVTNQKIKVDIYSTGQALLSIDIYNDSICMGDFKCMSYEQFNSKFLSNNYPLYLFKNIFASNDIFNSKNLIKSKDGYIQEIKSDKYDIKYERVGNKTIFRDIKNNILIKIRKIIK